MNVPFIDFSEQYNLVKDEIDVGLKSVFQKGNFILGEEEKLFEEEFARYCESEYAVGVNSGTDALYIALSALDIKPGDEVILPSYTFIATALCISYTGAKPVFVEIEEETYNIDTEHLKQVITDKTKVIMPVHLYGQPANMGVINAIAKEHNIVVIEDAAQAHGARYQGRKVGSLGDIACFSFYPTKSLGAFGDGGMVVTKNETLYKKMTMLRDYGRTNRYEHKIKGYNSRLDTVQAVILSAKLKHLDEWNAMRAGHADQYREALKDVEGLVLPKVKDGNTHVYQTFAVQVDNRDEVLKKMQDKGIGVLIHYPIPVHLQKAYQELGYKQGDLPVSERCANRIMSLPMFPHMNQEQIKYVSESLKESLGAKNELKNAG